ncbi:MAG TPA: hypothetical protein VGJ09_11260, partial [Bryobacteraceae bacterium]
MKKLCVLFAVLACAGLAQNKSNGFPRTADGKPNFSGTYEWPKAMSGEQCRCSATIFDRSLFAP